MINVTVIYQNNKFLSLTIEGHANSNEYGKDLVCAATSAVITGGVNNIKDIKNFKVTLEEGYAEIIALGKVNDHDEIVLETIVSGLMTIEETNKKFIRVTRK